MKILRSVILLASLLALWTTSGAVKTLRLNKLLASGKIPYGPIPNLMRNYYSFDGFQTAFNTRLDLKRAHEFSKNEFQELILESLDGLTQKNMKRYLPSTLSFSEDYQIDPFWILAIMMVESGFDKTAKSSQDARGLMQIRPQTAEYIYQLMNKKISDEQIQRNLHYPEENIEVGIFYLKKLLQNFGLNYHFATIAYNMGPNKLKNLLDSERVNLQHSSYLRKVQECYYELSKNFFGALKKRPRPYESTYVVYGQGLKLDDQLLEQFVIAEPHFKMDFLISSENLNSFSSATRSF
jgi:soluble lytic murein transglycosylase-like protein